MIREENVLSILNVKLELLLVPDAKRSEYSSSTERIKTGTNDRTLIQFIIRSAFSFVIVL